MHGVQMYFCFVNETLEMDVGEDGGSFSAGEKQLISLARAILYKRPIVIMDEATANVDYNTDELIQSTIQNSSSFKNKTIFIIAHRIRTILNCDRIAVIFFFLLGTVCFFL